MGFALTLIFIVITIVSPYQFGQQFAAYHPMIYLAAITALASMPGIMSNSRFQSSVQFRLVLGFIAAVVLSNMTTGWFGGAIESLRDILPVAAVFVFILANVTTLRRLKIITLVTIGTCLVLSIEALCGYYGGFHSETFVLLQYGEIRRLRAVGFLSDPNDFAQILLIALCLTFAAWNRGRMIVNLLIVIAPSTLLLWCIYLTHSRGALIALAAVFLTLFHKKIGGVPSAVLAGCLILGMMALDFTGGRAISADAGSDRLELWSQGLQLFKTAPLFGIGFGRFMDFSNLTAHNSFVLCLAELGLVGSTIFVGLLVTTLLSLNGMMHLEDEFDAFAPAPLESENQAQLDLPARGPAFHESSIVTAKVADREVRTAPDVDEFEIKLFVVPMRLALISFMSTSFFLSRSYTVTMFLIIGLAAAIIARGSEVLEFKQRQRWGLYTLAAEFSAIIFIYAAVRFRH